MKLIEFSGLLKAAVLEATGKVIRQNKRLAGHYTRAAARRLYRGPVTGRWIEEGPLRKAHVSANVLDGLNCRISHSAVTA